MRSHCIDNAFICTLGEYYPLGKGNAPNQVIIILVMEIFTRTSYISTNDTLINSMRADDIVVVPGHSDELKETWMSERSCLGHFDDLTWYDQTIEVSFDVQLPGADQSGLLHSAPQPRCHILQSGW